MKRLWILGILTTACASRAPTPYQPIADQNKISGGYSDRKVGENKFLVKFSANAYTDKTIAEDFAFKRAQELCQALGKKEFELIQKLDNSQTRTTASNVVCNKYGNQTYCNDYGGQSYQTPEIEMMISCAN